MTIVDRFINNRLKLRHLRLLLALDELRSVRRVAAYLNITQPAVSKSLSEIEHELELPLFHRTPRGLEATEHGDILLRHAREILGHLNQVKDELHALTEGRMTRVLLGTMPAATVQLIPRVIAQLSSLQPMVSISVREGTVGSLITAMRSGELDIALGLLSEARARELESEELFEDYVVAVVRPDHPLLGKHAVAWADIARYPMILPPQGSVLRTPIEAYLAQHGLGIPRWNVETISVPTNIGVLQVSDAIAFLSAEMARHYVANGTMAVLPVDLLRLSLHVGLLWMPGKLRESPYQLVRHLIHETRDAMLPDMRRFRQHVQAAIRHNQPSR